MTPRPTLPPLAAALACLAMPAMAADVSDLLPPGREAWLIRAETMLDASASAAEGTDPLLAPMLLCEERGCDRAGWQSLNTNEAGRLRHLFAEAGDAAGERHRIGKAIALLESAMGARNGTWRDHPANERESETEAGQMDCIAESINTQTYLDRLFLAGLVRHHQPGGFIHRYTVVLQHVAVQIVETESQDRYAVDSWVGANGDEPDILPYGDWRWEWGV